MPLAWLGRIDPTGNPPLDALVPFGKPQVENCANAKMAKSGWEWRIESLA